MKTNLIGFIMAAFMMLIPAIGHADSSDDLNWRELLIQTADELNEECPIAVDEDAYITSVYFKDNNFTMVFKYSSDDVDFTGWDDDMKELFKELLLEELKSDEDFSLMIDMCYLAECNMRLVMVDKNGERISLIVPYDED